MSTVNERILARLRVAADISTYVKPQQRICANGPTARQVANDALDLPRVDGDEELRATLNRYLSQPGGPAA